MLDANKTYGVGGNKSLREAVEKKSIEDMLQEVRDAADEAITRVHNAVPLGAPLSETPTIVGEFLDGRPIYRRLVDLSGQTVSLNYTKQTKPIYVVGFDKVATTVSFHIFTAEINLISNVDSSRNIHVDEMLEKKLHSDTIILGRSGDDMYRQFAKIVGAQGKIKFIDANYENEDIFMCENIHFIQNYTPMSTNFSINLNSEADYRIAVINNSMVLIVNAKMPEGLQQEVLKNSPKLYFDDFKLAVEYVKQLE